MHHEFMKQYVFGMAHSLYQWDKKYGSKKDLGWDYYYSMAFGGLFYVKKENNTEVLEPVDAFKALVPNKKDRDKILKILTNEQN